MCQQQTKTEQEPGPMIDDPAEMRDGFDRELLAGPIQDLCEFFGLSSRAVDALQKLKVETGRDIVKLNPIKIHLFAGDVTGRRINLLKEWARLRLAELGAAAGPSQGTNSNAVINVAP